MRILGIDPALSVTGYGAIEYDKNNLALVEAGIIETKAGSALPERLNKIYSSVKKLIADIRPDAVVLEKIYSHYRHPATSYLLGHARGVICLAVSRENALLIEYAATRVKKAVVGKGLASKFQVQRMVQKLLDLKSLPRYNDVTDALALAIAHCYILRTSL